MLVSTVLTAVATLSTLVVAAPPARPAARGNTVQVIENCSESGTTAATFDDGPYDFDSDLLKTLADDQVKATFFVNGNNYRCIYNLADNLKQIHEAGHTIGSHTWSHPHMNTLTRDQIHDELWKIEQAMIKILGLKPLYFRFPYGEYNELGLEVLSERGYKKAFVWSQDSGDTVAGVTADDQKKVYDQMASQFPAPHNILQHSVKETTVKEVVPYGIPVLKNAGYRVVALDTCLGSNGEYPYEVVGAPQARDASWVC